MTGTCASVWSFERGESAASGAQETMIHTGYPIVSNDRAHGSDVLGLSALCACPRSWSTDRGDGALTSAQVAVINIVRVSARVGEIAVSETPQLSPRESNRA